MIFESKYNFGDKVYSIEKISSSKWEECEVCSGKGKIIIKSKEYSCPECRWSGGKHIHTGLRWKVNYLPKTIGRISVEIYPPKHKRRNKDDYSYMCNETGVGSGTVWYQCDLYESEELAKEMCNKLNSIIEEKREKIKRELLNGRTMDQYGLWSELEKEINNRMKDFDGLNEIS